MIIDSTKYGGLCECGKEHYMNTRLCIIEAGALEKLEEYLAQVGITGKRCAVYGSITFNNPAFIHPTVDQEIVLQSEGLHADEKQTQIVLDQLDDDVKVLLACGSGSIHDTVRFCAAKKGLDFVALPTAASVDGFCSTVAAMTWYGYKKTFPAIAPKLVVADLNVISKAPSYLTASGVADVLGKYIALADWQISNAITGEYICQRILKIVQDAVKDIWDSCLDTLNGDIAAYEKVMYGLIMSGLAMQLMGNSRPASGAEHHVSHIIEMRPSGLGNIHSEALHGEKVGVGTLMAAREYHRLAKIEDITGLVEDYKPLDEGEMRSLYGELYDGAAEENQGDCLAKVTPEALVAAWPKIREIINTIPTEEEIYEKFEKLGAKRCLADIDVSEDLYDKLIENSPTVRNRLTLMRIKRMLKA